MGYGSVLAELLGPTERPRYWPHEGHTRWETMGAEQFGQGIRLGASTLSWWARRMSRLLLVFRRLGTATSSLLAAQTAGDGRQRREPRIDGRTQRDRRGRKGPTDTGILGRAQVRSERNHRQLEQDEFPQK